MNREILFRGKRVDNGEWIEGNLLKFCWKTDILTYIATIDFNPFDMERTTFRVVPETVRQFTGLCDRNGKKVFEGDIIKYCPVYDNIEEIGYIKWHKNSATYIVEVTDGAADDFWIATAKKCEVIGNVHENPELLEVNENE